MKSEREKDMQIFYRNVETGTRRVDFLVENKVMVELKAVSELIDTHFSQIINYPEAYKPEIGLLINSGEKSLTYKHFIKTKS